MAPPAIKLLLVFSITAILMAQVLGKVFYVSSSQNNAKRSINDKQFDKTLGNIQECIDNLKDPGASSSLGSYHQSVTIANKHGTKESPIIIRGSPDCVTKLDGTVPLRPANWEKIPKGAYNMYKVNIAHDITQLFIDGEMMTNARSDQRSVA